MTEQEKLIAFCAGRILDRASELADQQELRGLKRLEFISAIMYSAHTQWSEAESERARNRRLK